MAFQVVSVQKLGVNRLFFTILHETIQATTGREAELQSSRSPLPIFLHYRL